jgi:signal peptidase I
MPDSLRYHGGERMSMEEQVIPMLEPEVAAASATTARPPRTVAGMLRAWARDVLISLGVAAFIIIFIYQPVKVEGTSMLPALSDQERIFVNKFVYRVESISRGDVIVFRYPLDPSQSFIKRVVAVAGDRVHIDSGLVYVNDQPVSEPYVPPEYRDDVSLPELTVPAGTYFVLGDHRSRSEDSRKFGPVAEEFVSGKAVFAYWPFEKAGRLR